MRGTRFSGSFFLLFIGIIPAYAGNTFAVLYRLFALEDHPRVCGEHPIWFSRRRHCLGSSPRMRGTHRYQGWKDDDDGIIPAYAGNTVPYAFCPPSLGDHPRVCGEHHGRHGSRLCRMGSSPRMRGTPLYPNAIRFPRGIIPAYAGNTAPTPPARTTRRDHPRVCGEHFHGAVW